MGKATLPRIRLLDGARINDKQRETIQGAYLDEGVSCDVYPSGGGCVTVVPTGEEAWTGHTVDEDGDYLFPTVAVVEGRLVNVQEITKVHYTNM